jgi:hypothetical protein
MEDLKAILTLMFEPEEEVCVSNSQWAYHSMPQATILSGEVPLVSPNQKVSIQRVKTDQLTLLCINPVVGFRKDSTVTSHRNFLFELDIGSLSSQMRYMRDLGMSYSASIFSGNKSIHFLVCLDQGLDVKTYRQLYNWALNIGTLFDQNCKNPSRCIRIPGAVRPDTDREQRLIELKSRVKLEDFMAWLNKYEHLRPKEREPKNNLTFEKDYDRLSIWLRRSLRENDLDFSKGRNKFWYAAFYDFAKAGYSQEEAEAILESFFQEEHDFKTKEWLSCSKSAYDHVLNKG